MIRDRSPYRRQPPCVPELVTSGRGSVGMYASVQLEAAHPTAERENPMQRLRAADDFVAIRARLEELRRERANIGEQDPDEPMRRSDRSPIRAVRQPDSIPSLFRGRGG